MKLRYKILLVLLVVSVGVIALLTAVYIKSDTEFQKNADIMRLKHIQHYGDLIASYKEKTGYYPFQGLNEIPIYVYVANDEQIEFTEGGPSYSYRWISFREFILELENALGHSVEEFYDPQFRPVNKPNFYMYLIKDDTYYFAVHVHQPFSFARKVAEHYYKIEITNKPTSQNRAISPETLFNSPEFKAEMGKAITREGLFKKREKRYLHYTKSIKPIDRN